MRRTVWYNNVQPQEQQFTNETIARIEETLERFRDTTTRGIRRGLQLIVTPDSGGLKFTITAGQGYTPKGERINLLNDVSSIPLGPTSGSTPVSLLSTDGYQINANGTYIKGVSNYVFLRYIEKGEAPLQERIIPRQHLTIYKPSFEIEVLTEDDVDQLVGHMNVDVSAVPFPEIAPFPSRDFRLLVGVIIANGVGVEMTDANILSSDPTSSQPQDITGVTITTLSSNTPPGVGRLRFDPTSQVITWRAPSDSAEGAPVSVPEDTGFITLTSATTSFQATLHVVPDSLPTTEVQESISILTRLNLTFPQPVTQPSRITGVSVLRVSINTPLGSGTLSYDPTAVAVAWQAPGDAIGTPVSIAGGGSAVLRSGNDVYTMSIFISDENLPTEGSEFFDEATGLITESISIRGLYDPLIPIQTADDVLHRSMVGSGVPTPGNPHATSLTDILNSTENNVFRDHQNRFHKNALASDASSSFLKMTVPTDDTVVLTPPASSNDVYLIDGVIHTEIKENTFQFVGTMPTGFYLIYMAQDETVQAARMTDLPSLSAFGVDDNVLPTSDPAIRILDIYNTYTPNPNGRVGTLDIRPFYSYPDGTFTNYQVRWKAPGDTDFGSFSRINSHMFLRSKNGDWIRITFNLDELDLDQDNIPPASINYTIYLDALAINKEKVLPIASVLWDQSDEQIRAPVDLRSFRSADNRDELVELQRDITKTSGDQPTLEARLEFDRASMHDNGIVGQMSWNDPNDADADAYLVEAADSNDLVTVRNPKQTTVAWVNGRQVRSITGIDTSSGAPVAPASPPEFSFSADAAVNSSVAGTPDQVCTVNSLVIDEFGHLKSYTRLLEDGDIATKAIRGFQITDMAETWPAGATMTLQYTGDSPESGYGTFTLVYSGTGDSVTVSGDAGTWRLYAGDAKNWIEITRVPTISMPGGGSTITATATYRASLDTARYLELARVAYDGSAEITRIIDKRRFGTIGRRALATDALHPLTDKRIGDELHAETRTDGVIRGLEVTGINTATINWDAGVVVVNGKRITVPAGSWNNTFSAGKRWVYIDEDRYVKISALDDFRKVLPGRRIVLLAKVYIDAASTSILNIEDVRLRPSLGTPLLGRRYTHLATGDANTSLIAGLDPSPEYVSGTGQRSAGWWFNCYRTRQNGSQTPSYWLEDETKDGLFALAIQNMDPVKLHTTWGYSAGILSGNSSSDPKSQFAFFRVPAGTNPRPAALIEPLGIAGWPLEIKSGNSAVVPSGGSTAVFTRVLDFAAGDFRVTTDNTGYTLVEAIGTSTPPPTPPPDGDGVTVTVYGSILSADGLGVTSGGGIVPILLHQNITANAGDPITINVSTQAKSGPGNGDLTAKFGLAFNENYVTYGDATSRLSIKKDSYLGVSFSVKALCRNGKNSLYLTLESSDPGRPSLTVDDRIQWNATVYHI